MENITTYFENTHYGTIGTPINMKDGKTIIQKLKLKTELMTPFFRADP